MPIKEGTSKKIIGENIRELVRAGYTRDRAIAIALRKAGKLRRKKIGK